MKRLTGLTGFCMLLALMPTVGPAVPGPATNEAAFLTHIRQLTFEGRRSGEGYFSPDGRKLVFQSEREPGNPFYQIYLLDLETGDSHRVSPGVGKTTCAFFRPGTDEVLFASTHLDPGAPAAQQAEWQLRASGKERRYSWDYDASMDIFVARQDGSQIRRLTDAPGYDAEAAYSPDGGRIVFSSLRSAYPTNRLSPADLKRLETDPAWFGEIYIMNADGSGQVRLTHTPGYDGGPFFSPDGRRIIWRRFDERGATADVFTMKTDGSDERRLTDFGAMSWAPYFHPSGAYVIFTANKLGFANFELYLVDAAGAREPVRVTFTDGFDGLPVFSPDGRKLCWTSNRTADRQSQLFLAEWNHAAALAALGQAPARGQSLPPAAAAPGAVAARAASADIALEDLRRQVGFLASEALAGRMTGSTGAQMAAEFIAKELRTAGLKPVGTNEGFFQNFAFHAGVRVLTNQNRLVIASRGPQSATNTFAVERDFRPLSFTASGSVEGEVVFAGYGLQVPGKPGEGYDSYAGLDVSNKIVLALRYVPEAVEPKRRQELNRYAGLRYKAMLARERGARAILFVTGPNSPNAGEMVPLAFDSSLAGSGILAASLGSNAAAALLAGSGRDWKTVQEALDTENPHAASGFTLTNLTVHLATAVEHLKKQDRNVVGALPPTDDAPATEWVLVGAHYDHLGHGETGAMNRKGEEQQIHFGADDNASGTAAVLELAAALAAERTRQPSGFRRGIIFALWSGEEIGLIGSSHFAEHPPLPLSNVVAYLNFDMVGRLTENRLLLQGVGSSTFWRKLIERRNVVAGFDLVLQDDPYLPTDVTAFYPRRVPVLNFFTGSHEDYHRPTDTAERVNYEGLERIVRFARSILLDLVRGAERPDYVEVKRGDAGGGSRESLRAYLGTIPDYATEVVGVKLAGVRGGGPADKAGLRGGDIIVEFAGQKIANIYDYTYAMDAVKIGQPVQVVVQRAGQRVALTIVPEARK
ncbi:MAG TPA: M28 family peptidase [Methylomirabilota bacterium]|nr:M28 family peptidase [Methylomirabilota bacterium]